MPLYEYRCDACGIDFEKIRPFRDGESDCDKCGQRARRKISIPAPAIVQGGTHAGKSGMMTLGDFPDRNEWVDG